MYMFLSSYLPFVNVYKFHLPVRLCFIDDIDITIYRYIHMLTTSPTFNRKDGNFEII